MPSPASPPPQQQLADHKVELAGTSLLSLFAQPGRATRFTISAAGLTLDYSKHFCTQRTLELFEQLAEAINLRSRIDNLFDGAEVNNTEQRPALHTSLRSTCSSSPKFDEVAATKARMRTLVQALHQQQLTGFDGRPVRDVVNIGIGGSDLGPRFVNNALEPFATGPVRVHFVANIDPDELHDVLNGLNPATTLFITASKSFATLETLSNTQAARRWLQAAAGDRDVSGHFVAVTANTVAAVAFGISEDKIFPMWDWVGGRYSLWSAIGLPTAIAVGWDGYTALLDGASAMDTHFRESGVRANMPMLLALLECWYSDHWQAHSVLTLPYSHRLGLFPAYLQQLSMESLGKSVTQDGKPVSHHTGLAIWGEPGTNGQHSFMQLLHQGTRFIPVDFIAVMQPGPHEDDRYRHLFANCLSQSHVLMAGKSAQKAQDEMLAAGMSPQRAAELAPHREQPGNRPSSTIVMHSLTPTTLGALIALYEHKVYTQSIIWGINAFDQWGVELGKKAASDIFSALGGGAGANLDESTVQLIQLFQKLNP
jgi:glucose-6-phosphate isomerase